MQPTKLLPRAVQRPQGWVSMAHPLRRLTLLLPALCPPHSGSGAVAALGVLPADPLAAQAPQCDLANGQAMASLGAPAAHGRQPRTAIVMTRARQRGAMLRKPLPGLARACHCKL